MYALLYPLRPTLKKHSQTETKNFKRLLYIPHSNEIIKILFLKISTFIVILLRYYQLFIEIIKTIINAGTLCFREKPKKKYRSESDSLIVSFETQNIYGKSFFVAIQNCFLIQPDQLDMRSQKNYFSFMKKYVYC